MQRLQPRVFANANCQWLRRSNDLVLFASQSFAKPTVQVRCATHAAAGHANGPKDGAGKRLGAKKTGDEYVVTGNIIFRQRGTLWFPGENAGMGRDHTIFALECGYVKYYRDPAKHPKRRYIGIVLDKNHSLPTPPNAARRRRLGLVVAPRATNFAEESAAALHISDIAKNSEDVAVAQESVGNAPVSTKQQRRQIKLRELEAERRRKSGRLPVSELEFPSDYSFRETNWSIGRAAERAGVNVIPDNKRLYRYRGWKIKIKKRKRWLMHRATSKKQGKKGKAGKRGGRKRG